MQKFQKKRKSSENHKHWPVVGAVSAAAVAAASIDGIDGIRVCLRRHSFIYELLVFIRWMHYFYYYSSLACTNKQHIYTQYASVISPLERTKAEHNNWKWRKKQIRKLEYWTEFNGFSMRYLLDLFMFDDAWKFIEAAVRLTDYIFQWILNNRTSTWLHPPPRPRVNGRRCAHHHNPPEPEKFRIP